MKNKFQVGDKVIFVTTKKEYIVKKVNLKAGDAIYQIGQNAPSDFTLPGWFTEAELSAA